MENHFLEDDVRKRLILAGLDELCEHGIRDFSLRRVAVSAQVSCAAPYRHFKDKEELIGGIVEYISSKWQLLCRAIEASFSDNPKSLATELAVANIRFWLANGNFRTVLMIDGNQNPKFLDLMRSFDAPILSAIEQALPDAEKALVSSKQLAVRSIIYGAVLLFSTGRAKNTPDAIDEIKNKILSELN